MSPPIRSKFKIASATCRRSLGLYEDLSVQENLDLYADLHGVTAEERRERYPRLMEMTALGPSRNVWPDGCRAG